MDEVVPPSIVSFIPSSVQSTLELVLKNESPTNGRFHILTRVVIVVDIL
jgi:hypothetical protein